MARYHPAPTSVSGRRLRRPGRGLAAATFAVAAALASPACRADETPTVGREQFVDAYVGLVRARIDARGDLAAYAAKRERALLDADVTAEELRAFVEAGRDDPERLRAAWQAVAARLDTLYGGVTSQAPPRPRRGRDAAGAPEQASVIGDTLAGDAPPPVRRR